MCFWNCATEFGVMCRSREWNLDGASATKEEVGMLMTHLQEEGGSDAR